MTSDFALPSGHLDYFTHTHTTYVYRGSYYSNQFNQILLIERIAYLRQFIKSCPWGFSAERWSSISLPAKERMTDKFHVIDIFLVTKIPKTSPYFLENKISSCIHKYQSLDPKSSHINLVAVLTPQILESLFLSIHLDLSLPSSFFPSDLQVIQVEAILFLLNKCPFPLIILIYHPNNRQWTVNVIMYFLCNLLRVPLIYFLLCSNVPIPLPLLMFMLCQPNLVLYKTEHEKVRCHIHVQTAITSIT